MSTLTSTKLNPPSTKPHKGPSIKLGPNEFMEKTGFGGEKQLNHPILTPKWLA